MRRSAVFTLFAALLACGAGAQTLGGRVEAQASAAPATVRSFANYSVRSLRTADATEVREYVAPSGVIFGLSWQGPRLPDLKQYLGTRFAAFQAAVAQNPRRRGPLYVHLGTLVVENGGQMRALHGRAFLTDALPAGVTAAVIQ